MNAPDVFKREGFTNQVSVSWTAPTYQMGVADPTGYTIEYTKTGGSAQTKNVSTSPTSAFIAGIETGTSYSYRIRAYSETEGNGDWTSLTNFTLT